MSLSILTITKAEPFALPFLLDMNFLAEHLHAEHVIAADGEAASMALRNIDWRRTPVVQRVQSEGYLESVLDVALEFCTGDYVLRLDDDERCSPAMQVWLNGLQYTHLPHWKFARAHMWWDNKTVILHPQLWPDHQTRLSVRKQAGQRRWIHSGSPWGGGTLAPVVIEHHKFLVKTAEERRAIAARYDSIQAGAGTGGMLAFNVPEDCPDITTFPVAKLGQGVMETIR